MIALVFPGQGSQRPAMGAPWQDHPSWAVVSAVSESCGRDVAELLVEADAETLKATRNSQIAAFTLSMVILDAALAGPLQAESILAVAGHSLGEYSALVAASALDLSSGAVLVRSRGDAMQAAADANPGTMAAVIGLDPEATAKACGEVEGAWVANDNAPGQVVIAGTFDGVKAAGEAASALGAKRVIPLQVGGAFHSPLMAPAATQLNQTLAGTHFGDAKLPVVCNVDASAHTDGFEQLLSAQLCSQVRWRESLTQLSALGADLFIELGPGTELSGMVRRTVTDARRANVAAPEDLDALAAII